LKSLVQGSDEETCKGCILYSVSELLTLNLLFLSPLSPEESFQDFGALNFKNPFVNLHPMVEFIA